MQPNNDGKARPACGRRFSVHWLVLAIGLAAIGSKAIAAPFAYVTTNTGISVIDTATNQVSSTIPVIGEALAVAPNGKRVYVSGANGVAVINTATNAVVTTIPAIGGPVAIAPDGAHAYAGESNAIAVIDTASNTITATVMMPSGIAGPSQIAIAPDGKHAYVLGRQAQFIVLTVFDTTNFSVSATVSLESLLPPTDLAVTPDGKLVYVTGDDIGVQAIDTSTFTVISGGASRNPLGVAVAPNGKFAYVSYLGFFQSLVGVADADTNAGVVTVSLPPGAPASGGIAVTPDSKSVYATLQTGGVSVIDAATNTITVTIPVSGNPINVAIAPDIPYGSMTAELAVEYGKSTGHDAFELASSFTLGKGSSGFNPASEPVTLQIGNVAATIPSGSFKAIGFGLFTFVGTIDGMKLEMLITRLSTNRYALVATGQNASFVGTPKPVPVRLTVGGDGGTISTRAISVNLS
ncbi:MAG TPA: YncE family protein [Aliidongia sp.]|nr:YncE family protein [Aliidongia sp.]